MEKDLFTTHELYCSLSFHVECLLCIPVYLGVLLGCNLSKTTYKTFLCLVCGSAINLLEMIVVKPDVRTGVRIFSCSTSSCEPMEARRSDRGRGLPGHRMISSAIQLWLRAIMASDAVVQLRLTGHDVGHGGVDGIRFTLPSRTSKSRCLYHNSPESYIP